MARWVLLLFSFFISGILEEYVVKNELEDELEGLAALFFEHERKPAVRIRGYVEEVVANLSDDRFTLLFARSVARAVIELMTQSITQVAAISACENKSVRYQCFFIRFNPV